MHLSFRVVLTVVAALTMSMTVSADTECNSKDALCSSKADCCHGYDCVPVLDLQFDEVSMSSSIQNLLTHRRGSLTTYIGVRNELP